MYEVLFENYDQLEVEDLAGYAADLGLDTEEFLRHLDDDRLARRLQRDLASAQASGVRGTPTFFVNGVRHVGPHDTRSLIAALERADSLSRP
jgi:predicted DsbA family dithiol-disulfide isomerase